MIQGQEQNNQEKPLESLKTSIGIAEVDSLKLRIPFRKITIINSLIVDRIGVYNFETGEELDEPKPRNWHKIEKFNKQGQRLYSYKLDIQEITLEKGVISKFLCIQLNSKMLEREYFKGISKETIKACYDQLMREKIVSFTLDTFMNAECTDIDIKKDVINEHFRKSISIFRGMSKEHKLRKKGVNPFERKENLGIEWSERRTATPSNPFLKLYSKAVQCVNHKSMIPFYQEFLKGGNEPIEHRVRIEYTLKNRKHLKKYGIENQRLKDILGLSQDKKNEILKDIVKHHLNPRLPKIEKPKSILKPLDMVLYNSMSYCIETTTMGKYEVIKMLTQNIERKQRKSETKKRLENIFDTYIQTKSKAKENEELSNLFNALNWL